MKNPEDIPHVDIEDCTEHQFARSFHRIKKELPTYFKGDADVEAAAHLIGHTNLADPKGGIRFVRAFRKKTAELIHVSDKTMQRICSRTGLRVLTNINTLSMALTNRGRISPETREALREMKALMAEE